MPSRIIREGLVDSESVSALDDWAFRVYSLLLLKVDDAGRYDARLEILRSHLFPLGTARRAQEVGQAIADAECKALLLRYHFAGKPILQITRWQRTGNSQRSKFPWSDGSIDIEYEEVRTKDGPKDFVKTSLIPQKPPDLTPSLSHPDGMPIPPNNEKRNPNGESQSPEGGSGGKDRQPVSIKRQFTDLWCIAYEHHFGVKYLFHGVKDGAAADRLIRLGISPDKLIEIAIAAWKRPTSFNCKNSTELSRFAGSFNAIRAEVTAHRTPDPAELF